MRDDHASRSPWGLLLPVALAVLIGQVLATWVERMLWPDAAASAAPVAVVADAPVPRAVADVPLLPAPVVEADADHEAIADVSTPRPVADVAPVPVVAPGMGDDASVAAVAPEPAPAASDGPALPGPISARQAGAGESCIGGTVATRSANGWEQALVDDAPVRCTATSQ